MSQNQPSLIEGQRYQTPSYSCCSASASAVDEKRSNFAEEQAQSFEGHQRMELEVVGGRWSSDYSVVRIVRVLDES
jgi:hypothetical protein